MSKYLINVLDIFNYNSELQMNIYHLTIKVFPFLKAVNYFKKRPKIESNTKNYLM